jgi:hypothetical protein
MSDSQIVAIFTACLCFGASLLSFLGKDILWKIEPSRLQIRGEPSEKHQQKRKSFDHAMNIVGAFALGWAIFIILYVLLA